jgi:hypothetical protein
VKTILRTAASVGKLESMLRDKLRQGPCYLRLGTVRVFTDKTTACGWTADVQGNFSADERRVVLDIVVDSQQRFSLVTP